MTLSGGLQGGCLRLAHRHGCGGVSRVISGDANRLRQGICYCTVTVKFVEEVIAPLTESRPVRVAV